MWHERDVLPKKVLQPQLEYLRSNPVLMEQPRDVLPKKDPASQLEHFKSNPVIAEQPRTIEEEFGCAALPCYFCCFLSACWKPCHGTPCMLGECSQDEQHKQGQGQGLV